MEVTDNNFLRQFETKVNGGLAIIEYSTQDRKIFLTKIIVPEIKDKDLFTEKFMSEVFEIITASILLSKRTSEILLTS